MLKFILSLCRNMWFLFSLLQRHSIKIILQTNIKGGADEFNSKNTNKNKSVLKK